MENAIIAGDVVWTQRIRNNPIKRGNIILFRDIQDTTSRFLVKRCIGEPGDLLEIRDGEIFYNNTLFEAPPKQKKTYQIKLSNSPNQTNSLDYSNFFDFELKNTKEHYNVYKINIQVNELGLHKPQLNQYGEFNKIVRPRECGYLFPWDTSISSSLDNYGPIRIPYRKMIIRNTDHNFQWFKEVIIGEQVTENQKVELVSNQDKSVCYRIRKDYIFVIGDNFHESTDSRHFGFVPVDEVHSKVKMVLFTYKKGDKVTDTKISFKRSFKALQ